MTVKRILHKTALLTALVALFFGAASCSKNSATEKPANVDYYTCTMHPSVHANEPGKCPICSMDLVPVMKKGASEAQPQASSPEGGGEMKDMPGIKAWPECMADMPMEPTECHAGTRRKERRPTSSLSRSSGNSNSVSRTPRSSANRWLTPS